MNTLQSRFYTGALKIFLSILVLSSGFSISAEENALPQDAHSLESRDIVGPFVNEALRNNLGISVHDKRFLAAKESISVVGSLPNPRVQLTHFVESIQTRTGPQRQALALQQPLPWLSKLDRKREAANAQSEALWHAYAHQQFQLIDKVANRVFEIAFHDKSIAIQKENIELLKRLEEVVEGRVRAGGDLNDLLRLQVEIGRFENEVARQAADRKVAEVRLEALLGRRNAAGLPILDWQAPVELVASPTEWIKSIANRSPQIAMLRSLESSQSARERLAKLASRPDFSVGINYIRTGEAINPAAQGSGDDPWALMLGVSLPIWGKRNSAMERQASLQKEALVAEALNLELELLAEGRALIVKLEDTQRRLTRFESQLIPLAIQAQEITQSSYQSGKSTVLDLIDSDRSLLKLKTEYWRAAADAWIARWKLATLSGGLWLD